MNAFCMFWNSGKVKTPKISGKRMALAPEEIRERCDRGGEVCSERFTRRERFARGMPGSGRCAGRDSQEIRQGGSEKKQSKQSQSKFFSLISIKSQWCSG